MSTNTKLFLLLMAVLIALYFLHRCSGNKPFASIQTTTETSSTVHIDTLSFRDTVYFPVPYKVVERCIDTLYVDTTKTIRDYFTEKYYQFSYSDTSLRAMADVLVAENSIELAKFDYQIFRPTIHTTTIITEKSIQRFSFLIGGGFNYNILDHEAGIEFLATIGIKRQNIYLGYDFINQTPRVGWQYRIK